MRFGCAALHRDHHVSSNSLGKIIVGANKEAMAIDRPVDKGRVKMLQRWRSRAISTEQRRRLLRRSK
jgi:hypothetical protein